MAASYTILHSTVAAIKKRCSSNLGGKRWLRRSYCTVKTRGSHPDYLEYIPEHMLKNIVKMDII